jgi:precorrin-6B methylase 2
VADVSDDVLAPGCVVVDVPADVDAELVAERCWLLGATAIGELVDPGHDGAAGGTVRLEVGFVSDADARAATSVLAEAWPSLEIDVVDAGPALGAALDAWKAYARPRRVGRLQVRPAWLADDDDPPGAAVIPVVVDPSRAFGYDHPSTVLCLVQVAERAGPGVAVLDVGCGSGVLALAAALLGSWPVVALDLEAPAVDATARGAARNGVEVEASTRPVGEEERRFGLVVANIGAATLTALAPAIAARVEVGGALVLAGLLDPQVPAIVATYEAAGLELSAVGEQSGWASPVFLRKSTFSGA